MTMSGKQKQVASGFKRLAKEPLVLFAVITLGIFIYDGVREQPLEDQQRQEVALNQGDDLATIRVSDTIVASLEDDFSWLQGRQPTATETDELVQNWVQDEMLFRHALQQQLHLSDSKLREHLIEKLSLLWAGMPDEPDEVQVLNYYMDNIDDYYAEPQVSFTQVFFEQRPDAEEMILQRLKDGEQIAGDGYWMGDVIRGYGESIMRTSFGGEFFLALSSASVDEWIGPLESPRGYHYVRLDAFENSQPLRFEQVYDRVKRNMMGAQQSSRIDQQLAEIKNSFTVVRESE